MMILPAMLVVLATITTVFAAESSLLSAQWRAQVQSDIDTINTSLDALIDAVNGSDVNGIVQDLASLSSDVHTAAQDVEAGPGVNDLASMAIIFYVQEQMQPKVEEAMSGLIEVQNQVEEAGKGEAVSKGLYALDGETKALGDALLFKTPTDKHKEAQVVIDEIIGDVENAAVAYA